MALNLLIGMLVLQEQEINSVSCYNDNKINFISNLISNIES